jgi:hypothetical protein
MMRFPRFKLRSLILAVSTFAGWFSLFHNYPGETTAGFLIGVPLFVLVVFEMALDDGRDRERRDRERRSIYRAYVWIGVSGILAFGLYLAVGGRSALPSR